MKISKELLLIIIILGILFFLISSNFTGLTIFPTKDLVPSEEDLEISMPSREELENCMKFNTSAQQEDCITSIAITYKNSSLCLYTPDAYKNACYGRVAIALKDISICDEMIPKEIQLPARNTCYVDAAIASDDKNLCEKVKDYDMDKYNYCLEIFEKIEACKKIESEYNRKICLVQIP